MDSLIDIQHSTSGLLASIAVILCAHLLFKMAELVFSFMKGRNEISEKSIDMLNSSVQRLTVTMDQVQKDLNEIPKFKLDLRRLFTAVKFLSGDRWPEVRKTIMEEDLTQ